MTTTAVTIQPASEADHKGIVDILIESYAEYKDTFQDQQRWEAYVKDIEESLDNPYLTIVGRQSGRPDCGDRAIVRNRTQCLSQF